MLAYNRAVVVELKSRLAKLFASLGLSRSASQLHVYTFHSLAKRVCGDSVLSGYEMNEWERILLRTIINKPNDVRAAMPDLQYVFIDEFQDITQTRLNAMFGLKKSITPSLSLQLEIKIKVYMDLRRKNLWIRIFIMNSFIRP